MWMDFARRNHATHTHTGRDLKYVQWALLMSPWYQMSWSQLLPTVRKQSYNIVPMTAQTCPKLAVAANKHTMGVLPPDLYIGLVGLFLVNNLSLQRADFWDQLNLGYMHMVHFLFNLRAMMWSLIAHGWPQRALFSCRLCLLYLSLSAWNAQSFHCT